MKRRVIIAQEAFHTITQCVLKADNNHETGGILIGYRFWRIYLVVAATISNTNITSSRNSFLLDGAEHTQKANDIISNFKHSPSVLGIWHSHICDGHKFSNQDTLSNRVIAKAFDGALSMLVTKSSHDIVISIYHISTTGAEKDCVTTIKSKSQMRAKRKQR